MITGLEFVEKLYSSGGDIYVIQKEFGIKQHLVNYLRNSINSSKMKKVKLDELRKDLENSVFENKSLKRKLIREAINSKAAIVNSQKNSTRDISNESIKSKLIGDISSSNNSSRDKKKLINLIKNRDYLINFNESSGGNASLAHEIGHIKANNDKITGKIHRLSGKFRSDFNNSSSPMKSDGYFEDGSSSILKGISRYLKGKVILENERSASKRALKLLKSKGATDEEIKAAKNLLNNDLKSYKEDVNAYWKVPIRNKLEGKKPIVIDKSNKLNTSSSITTNKINKTKERMLKKKRFEDRKRKPT